MTSGDKIKEANYSPDGNYKTILSVFILNRTLKRLYDVKTVNNHKYHPYIIWKRQTSKARAIFKSKTYIVIKIDKFSRQNSKAKNNYEHDNYKIDTKSS